MIRIPLRRRKPATRYHGRGRLKPQKVDVIGASDMPCICGCADRKWDGNRMLCADCDNRLVIGSPERQHDSVFEYERSEWLLLEQRQGHIRNLEFHPHLAEFPGMPQGITLDVRYEEHMSFLVDAEADPITTRNQWVVIYEDAKGIMTREWAMIRFLWQGLGCDWQAPGALREVRPGRTRKWMIRDYQPKER